MSKNYRLLVTAIVTALNPSDASARGTIYTPTTTMDVMEAEALHRVGYVEETTAPATAQTVAEKSQGKKPAEPKISGISVDAIRQPDGTFKSGAGVRVNEDGSEYVPTGEEALRAQYTEFLAHPADQVIAAIGQIPETDREAAFPALLELEKAGKSRVSVVKALTE